MPEAATRTSQPGGQASPPAPGPGPPGQENRPDDRPRPRLPARRPGGDDLTARLFRALYQAYDLHSVAGIHVAVPTGSPFFTEPSLGAIARQISDHEHPARPPTPPRPRRRIKPGPPARPVMTTPPRPPRAGCAALPAP
jgi:hypothetical protein